MLLTTLFPGVKGNSFLLSSTSFIFWLTGSIIFLGVEVLFINSFLVYMRITGGVLVYCVRIKIFAIAHFSIRPEDYSK